MDDASGVASIASQAKSAQVRGRSGREARRIHRTAWPDEVRAGGRGVFTSSRRLTGLGALGLKVDQVRFEVRSRKGAGVWVMGRSVENPMAHGRTLSEATAALVRMLAPDVEEVKDVNGKRLA
jgi:hypothetical protein